MDPRTGEIREFETEEQAKAAGFTVPVRCKPKPNCTVCYGRGYEGTNDQGQKVPCKCVMRRPKPANVQAPPT